MPSHGSLSKAGKIRNAPFGKPTFRQVVDKTGVTRKYSHKKKHKCPRVANKRKYRMYLLKQQHKKPEVFL